ncbi:hypothetical protein MJO29_010537 [Puccinia striiformis f. sp. tritici]|nr:hypothetical protein MJO29_010537 [Puccinia striiformis f. sp. tritici]
MARSNTRARNVMKSRARTRKAAAKRRSQYALNIQRKGVQEPIVWSFRNYRECHLYPEIEAEDKRPPRKPTPSELEHAERIVDTFHHFEHGKVVVVDKTNNGKIIAVIECTPLDKLSRTEKANINLVTTFLHESKDFVDYMGPSRTWGGRMWAFGWRKAMKAYKLFGVYVLGDAVKSALARYTKLVSRAPKVSEVIGRMFHNLADIPFNENRSFMAKNSIPSLSSFKFEDKLGKFDCAPHVTFTTDSYYNNPHKDTRDISTYAFAMFVPTLSANGRLADNSSGYDVSGGRFVMPDYNFCIDLSKEKCVVKLLWAASQYKHCTLPTIEGPLYTRMALSVQINNRTSNTARDLKSGEIYNRKSNKTKNRAALYVAGHGHYIKK